MASVSGIEFRHALAGVLGVAALLVVGACSRGNHVADTGVSRSRGEVEIDPRLGTRPSPRVVAEGDIVRKGGGTYKLGAPYKVAGRWYVPREEPGYDAAGTASWYGDDFHGRKTANGEIFDMNALTAAHPTLPLPSYAYVTHLGNGRTVLVRINDRGPYANDRIIDLSRGVARALGYEGQGLATVMVRYAGRAPLNGDDSRERQFLAAQRWRDGAAPAIAASERRPLPEAPPPLAARPQPADTAWSPLAHRASRNSLGGR